jgi:hypothetical protein
MLFHPTVERLRALGLGAMADTLFELQTNPDAAAMPHADWLGLLVDREATFRYQTISEPFGYSIPTGGCQQRRR